MVRRPDAVLALIPMLALSGVLAERVAPLVGSGPLARAGARLPLQAFGFVCALLVVGYAVLRGPSP